MCKLKFDFTSPKKKIPSNKNIGGIMANISSDFQQHIKHCTTELFHYYLAVSPALQPHQTHWGTSCRQRCAHHRSGGHRAAGRMRTHQPAGYRSRCLGQPLVLGNLPDIQQSILKAIQNGLHTK